MNLFGLELHLVTDEVFGENTYLLHVPGRKECLIFDPGLDVESVSALLGEFELTPVAILNTHGHADHIAGNGALKTRFPEAPILIGTIDAPKLTDASLNLSAGYGFALVSPKADRLLKHRDRLDLAGISMSVRETPGHSAGHVVFVLDQITPTLVFGGDVLFEGGIGRTDFPDGNAAQLDTSIQEQLFTLPDETIVLPGHGSPTTIGIEKETNPYVGRQGKRSIRWR